MTNLNETKATLDPNSSYAISHRRDARGLRNDARMHIRNARRHLEQSLETLESDPEWSRHCFETAQRELKSAATRRRWMKNCLVAARTGLPAWGR